jgi:hypothetical protein
MLKMFFSILIAGAAASLALAEPASPNPGITARVNPLSRHVAMNQPIWVEFLIENTSNEPVTLTVPGTEPAIPSPEVGLPLAHIFSGSTAESGVVVVTETGRSWDQRGSFSIPHPPARPPRDRGRHDRPA